MVVYLGSLALNRSPAVRTLLFLVDQWSSSDLKSRNSVKIVLRRTLGDVLSQGVERLHSECSPGKRGFKGHFTVAPKVADQTGHVWVILPSLRP